jgi:hypothetical protein
VTTTLDRVKVRDDVQTGELHAYIRRSREGQAEDVVETWSFSDTESYIMAADHEDLLFVDGMDQQDVLLKFEEMHPPSSPGMCNRTVTYNNRGYGRRLPATVTFLDYEWYDGNSAEEVARLAQESPTKSVIVTPKWETYCDNWKWSGRKDYDHKNRKYVQSPSPLEEYGCYERKAERKLGSQIRTVVRLPTIRRS